jgi:hypothetical protein
MPVSFQSVYAWVPSQTQPGVHVINQPVVVTGQMQKQNGVRSFSPTVTAPGTVASLGTVANNTGYDCLVYATATTGIGKVVVLTYNGANTGTLASLGTVSSAATLPVLVPGPGAIVVTYTGTLSWVWQPV